MDLTKETIKTENVDDTSSDASTESKSRKREKSMLNQPPLKRSRLDEPRCEKTGLRGF